MGTHLRLFLLICAFPFTCIGGPSTSGGGFAVVCTDKANKITSAILLDLYEAEIQYNYKLMVATGDLKRDYVRASKNTYRLQGYAPPLSDSEIAKNVDLFFSLVEWLPVDEQLPKLGDTITEVKPPEGCAVEPMAVFYDSQNKVIIDQRIWNAMDSLSQAALLTHEIIYHDYRQMKVDPNTNSLDARLFTAAAYSSNLTPVNSGVPSNLKMINIFHDCRESEDGTGDCIQPTSYYLLNAGVNDDGIEVLRLQFTHLVGRAMITLTTLDVPKAVRIGEVFYFNSKQLPNWSAQAVIDRRYVGGAVKFLIRRGQDLVTEITF